MSGLEQVLDRIGDQKAAGEISEGQARLEVAVAVSYFRPSMEQLERIRDGYLNESARLTLERQVQR